MIRTIPKIALLVGALAMAGQASAHGGGWGGPAVLGALVGAAVVGSVVASQPREVVCAAAGLRATAAGVLPRRRPSTTHHRHRCTCSRRSITALRRSTTAHRVATMARPTAITAAAGKSQPSAMQQASPTRGAFSCG